MTGRYSRRVLEITGISVNALKNHPPVNDIENDSSTTLPPPRSRLRSYSRSESLSSFNDASSLSSLDEDEFDRESSEHVQQMFDDIDRVLYENENPHCCKQQIINECNQWKTQHPQYRILGKQILPETELGFETLRTAERIGKDSTAILFPEDEFNDGELWVEGKQMELNAPSVFSFCSSLEDPVLELSSSTSEEVIASDGHYEELIANDIDCRTPEFEGYCARNFWMAENLALKLISHEIINRLVEKLWKDVIRWLQPMIKDYVDHVRKKSNNVSLVGKLSSFGNFRLATAPPRSNLSADIEGILTVSAKSLQSRLADKSSFSVPATASYGNYNSAVLRQSDIFLSQTCTPVRRLQTAIKLTPLERRTQPVTPRHSLQSGRPLTLPPIQTEVVSPGKSKSTRQSNFTSSNSSSLRKKELQKTIRKR